MIFAFIIDYVINSIFHVSANSIFHNFFMTIGCILGFFDFIFLMMLVDKGSNNSLKISYPSNDTIKINKYLLNYKTNDIMIDIKAIQDSSSPEKYRYMLIIYEQDYTHSIELTLQYENKLGDFINNLIFEPKK